MQSFISILDLLLGLDNQLDGANCWRTSYLYESYFMSMNELILIDIILYMVTYYLRPEKKYCLFPISDRPYQNMCDPNFFYGFPKKKKFFFFFF